MTHRTYRLSISPEGAPAIRRVFDFDGRSSLADVHDVIRDTLITDDDDHLYVFFLSGRYWDKDSEYVDPRTEGPRADKALLFRLNLTVGRRFVYVFDYGDELRHELTVVSITETSVPLVEPVLVESVAEPLHPDLDGEGDGVGEEDDDGGASEEPPDAALVALAERVLAPKEQLSEVDAEEQELSGEKLELVRESLRAAGNAALELGQALREDLILLGRLTDWFGDDPLLDSLLDLPSALSFVGEFDLALAVAGAFLFMAREKLSGDMAIFDARAGRREAALARVAQNLETATDACLAEAKAGDVYRALGEWDAAEAYYRRSLAVAKSPMDRAEGALRISSLLIDTGREAEADAFLIEERRQLKGNRPSASTAFAPSVRFAAAGRNDSCPCGSGKKYKKCHGASA